ncbi:MAG: porin [Cytophagales bacterium]|nr:porin [Cytophagales bacterium]
MKIIKTDYRRILQLSICVILCFFGKTSAYAQEELDLDELLEMDLEKIVELQSAGRGDVGSFGYRLGTSNSEFQVHGYVTNEFINQQGSPKTFDNHYYNLLLGSQIGDKIFAEIQLEYEHGGEEIQARYAQIDYRVSKGLIFRTGKFLVPINTFNEYLYPEYINKAISRPFMNRNITPTAWAEVGVQIRGSFELSSTLNGFYSAYMVNGLEGTEGGDIRGMRGNNRDKNNGDKAIGGRFGVNSNKLELGTGVYNGKYSSDGLYGLTIISMDAGYLADGLTIRAEYSLTNMETSTEDISRNGASATISYVIAKKLEPVFRYDFMNWDDPSDPAKDQSRIYLGANYLLANTMNVKAGYEIVTNEGTDVEDNIFAIQLALGF